MSDFHRLTTNTLDYFVGGVTLLRYLGNDLSVVNAARVSFNKESEQFNKKDQSLLKFLLKHNHWTPFSHPQLQLRIKMPIFIARQWFKSTVGLTRNEVSRRYVKSPPEFYIPKEFREAADNVKQGSSDNISDHSEWFHNEFKELCEKAASIYDGAIMSGICNEQARAILPQNMYTEFWETGSLAAYLRIVGLRAQKDAQLEIQYYAKAIEDILQLRFPKTLEAFKELQSES